MNYFSFLAKITRYQNLEIRDPRKISIFCITLYCMNYFSFLAKITCIPIGNICNRGLSTLHGLTSSPPTMSQ